MSQRSPSATPGMALYTRGMHKQLMSASTQYLAPLLALQVAAAVAVMRPLRGRSCGIREILGTRAGLCSPLVSRVCGVASEDCPRGRNSSECTLACICTPARAWLEACALCAHQRRIISAQLVSDAKASALIAATPEVAAAALAAAFALKFHLDDRKPVHACASPRTRLLTAATCSCLLCLADLSTARSPCKRRSWVRRPSSRGPRRRPLGCRGRESSGCQCQW